MKNLKFHYAMKLSFDSPICNHRFTLKCIPQSNDRQQISRLLIDVYPNRFLSEDLDSFGNLCIYGHSEQEHSEFHIDVKGEAKTGICPCETAEDIYRVGYYKYQTEYTRPGEAICKYHRQFGFSQELSNEEKAIAMMHQLYGDFTYVQGVTNVATKAEEAMQLGQGVCQDYAHILLSLCRMERIPCRYVVGMLMGEGLSHAWVEIYQDGGWLALDPTNNLVVDDQHIKISNGRDYKDCTMNQGIFTGTARQTQQASVSVEELKEEE